MEQSLVFYVPLVTVWYIHITRDIKPSFERLYVCISVQKVRKKPILPTEITKEAQEWKKQEDKDLLSNFLMVGMILGET